MTETRDWIRFWFRRNDHEFEQQAERQRVSKDPQVPQKAPRGHVGRRISVSKK
jgi:hypothetical protein